jgi:hypothetical protein
LLTNADVCFKMSWKRSCDLWFLTAVNCFLFVILRSLYFHDQDEFREA